MTAPPSACPRPPVSLTTRWLGRPCLFVGTVESTNDEARRHLSRFGPEAHGAAFYTDDQRSGRGRHGRAWIAAPGAALALSVALWPPEGKAGSLSLLPVAASAAVARTLRDLCGLEAALKWPNDVLVGGRKVSGALMEAAWKGEEHSGLVLGAGVNLLQEERDWPADLRDRAASIRSLGGSSPTLEVLVGHLLDRMEPLLEDGFEGGQGLLQSVSDLWIHREGDMLEVQAGGETAVGPFLAIGPEGELVLEVAGEARRVRFGDVERLRRRP
ncbi:MAG: biotin--[acetyl-CoA-carboxylase] ligase [Acidobacteriota bacterium]